MYRGYKDDDKHRPLEEFVSNYFLRHLSELAFIRDAEQGILLLLLHIGKTFLLLKVAVNQLIYHVSHLFLVLIVAARSKKPLKERAFPDFVNLVDHILPNRKLVKVLNKDSNKEVDHNELAEHQQRHEVDRGDNLVSTSIVVVK